MKGQYWSYRDRKARKRTFRNLWVTRINAAVRGFDMTYSRFIEALAKAKIDIDRKILADLSRERAAGFRRDRAELEEGLRPVGKRDALPASRPV